MPKTLRRDSTGCVRPWMKKDERKAMDLGDEYEIKPRLVPEEEYNSVEAEVNKLVAAGEMTSEESNKKLQ